MKKNHQAALAKIDAFNKTGSAGGTVDDLRHVLIGANDFSLPDDYIGNIQAVDAITDRDSAREEKELSIYS